MLDRSAARCEVHFEVGRRGLDVRLQPLKLLSFVGLASRPIGGSIGARL